MPRLTKTIPRYRLHKHSEQAIVTLNGLDHYLGPHKPKPSVREYNRLNAAWLAGGRSLPADAGSDEDSGITIVELLAVSRRHAKTHYRKNGVQTRTLSNIDDAIRPLNLLFGPEPVRGFGPLKLKAIQSLLGIGYDDRNANHVAGI